MVNTVALVLMKGDKILLLKRSKNRLPIISMKNEEKPEECIERWKEGRIEFEDSPIINYSKKINIQDYNVNLMFIDVTNSEVKLIDESLVFEECRWANNINKVENDLLINVLTECSINNYQSFAVEALKEFINMNSKYKVRNSKIDVEKQSMDTNKALILIAFSLGIGILFSRFIFGYLGISVAILTILMTVIFMLIIGVKNKSFLGYFFVASSIILSFTYGIFTNEFFRVLNLIVIPISLFSGFLLLTFKNIEFKLISFGASFLEIIIGQSLGNSTKIPSILNKALKKGNIKKENDHVKSILIGLAISIPLIIILGILLAGADEIFSYYLANIWRYLNIENIYDFILKAFIAIIVMFLVFGLYYSLNCTEVRDVESNLIKKDFNSTTIITILISITILYLVFTKIQISYLYLNKALPAGFNFADYARTGFFQLVALVIVNLSMITIMNFKTATNSKNVKNSLNTLYSVITVLTMNMGASAIYKMNLYIGEFGYTRLRILVQAFTVFLFISLIILLVFIWRGKYLLKPMAIVGLTIYLFLNYINIDNYIAKQNINIINTKHEMDDRYLTRLSLDAQDAVKDGYDKGLIESKYYYDWYNKRVITKHWYEYNYFNNRIFK
ncbi:DUF4173 domain-containing protein [Clostridium sp. DSM 100503]|uniref:DUF4153 domain-containing protein n=1 Tax=Clostridium sp. DSM 100503 TaxID=2963282 RepID=UPI00214A5E47|nr:DUF4173 domain-containing protein [Clostridium sp. DSM 100503]MCR1951586.1 DUF4173 domain-containing protein [Clostridium sp. DSM 100503]